MVGTDRNRLEAGAGEERKHGGGGRKDTTETAGTTTVTPETELSDSEKGSGEEASLGASGFSGAELSGAED